MERLVDAAASSQITENNIQHAGMISAGHEGFCIKRDMKIRQLA
jgi:hypothetical protein